MTDLPAADAQALEAMLVQGGMAALFRPGVLARVAELYAAGVAAGRAEERGAAELQRIRTDVQREVARLPHRVG